MKKTKLALKKVNSRTKVSIAIRKGILKKLPCISCGSTLNIQAHHEDYEKPLEVTWLCRNHHYLIHDINVSSTHKVCKDCGKKKLRTEYTPRNKKGWINSCCKSCMVKRSLKWMKENRAKYNNYQREYQLTHYEKRSNKKS